MALSPFHKRPLYSEAHAPWSRPQGAYGDDVKIIMAIPGPPHARSHELRSGLRSGNLLR